MNLPAWRDHAMCTMTVTTTFLQPPMLHALQKTTTHQVPGTAAEAAANYRGRHPQYQAITNTHMRYYEKHETAPANAGRHRPIVPGTWEIIDVRFTDNPAEEPSPLPLFEEVNNA